MQTGAKILIVGGVGILLYSFFLGFALARARKGGAAASRYLVLAHMGGIMQGTMLLALTATLPMSTLSANTETLAALLLLAGAVTIAMSDTMSWLGKTQDAFAEKPIGFYVSGVGATLLLAGLAIIGVGVVGGL